MHKTLRQSDLESCPLPVWVCDQKTTRFVAANHQVLKTFGFSEDEWKSRFAINCFDKFRSPDCECVQHLKVSEKNVISLWTTTSEVEYEGKSCYYILGYPLPESTKANSAPSEIISSTACHQAMVATTIICIVDSAGRIRFANENFARLSGYSNGELTGHDHRVANTGFANSHLAEMLPLIDSGGIWKGEIKNRKKDGSEYWVAVQVKGFREGDDMALQYLFTCEEITARKQAEENVLREQQRLSYALKFARMGIAEFNRVTQKVVLSPEFQELLEEENFINNELALPTFLEQYVLPEDRNFVNEQILGAAANDTRQHLIKTNFRIRTATGRVKNVEGFGAFNNEENSVGLIQLSNEKHVLEEDLKEITERLTLATTAAEVGIFDYNFITGELVWDAVNHKIFGTDDATEKDLNKWIEVLHPEDMFAQLKYFETVMDSHDNYKTEFRIIRVGDKAIRNIKALGVVKRDANRKAVRLVGVNWDITDQKTAEEKIKRSEAIYRSIVDGQPDAICRYNEFGEISFANKSYVDNFGSSSEMTSRKSFVALFPYEKDKVTALQHRLFVKERQPETIEFEMEMKGSRRWWQWNHIPLKNASGEVYEVQAIGQDITKRKELEAQQERLNKIVRESYNEIYLFHPNSLQFEFANDAALKNLGYTLGQLTKMRMPDLFHYPNEMAIQILLKGLLTGETDRLQLKLRHRRKNGTYYDIETVIQVLESGNSFVAIATDITQKLETERKLLSTIIEKEALIKEIHHRVKNNLQLISSIIYIKQNSAKLPEIKYFLNDMRQKIHSVALIHERLLQSEKLDKVEIADYLGRMIYDLNSTNSREDTSVEIISDLDRVTIDIDTAIYCALIVNELITNAIKHAFQGNQKGIIEVKFKKLENGYMLSVIDNGATIPEHIVPGESKSFGMHLLEIFVKQLRGSLEIIRNNGSVFNISFNLSK